MDRVQEIAATIAKLPLEEKQRLFQLLIDRGELPARAAVPAPHASQMELIASTTPNGRPPDYVLIFDGGSKGNPGWGYGSYAIVRVRDGAQRLERLDLGDGYTNNEAEYHGLLAALRLAKASGASRVEIKADSELIVRQIEGRYRVKAETLKPLYAESMRLISRFSSFKITHVRREQNKDADRLVQRALDLALISHQDSS